MSQTGLRAVVLYNAQTLPSEHADALSESDVVEAAQAVHQALARAGFDAVLLAAAPPVEALVARLTEARPRVVFNLVEAFGGSSRGEAHVAALLELLGLPYTGCPPEAQALCRGKAATKALLKGLGLPTAPFLVAEAGRPIERWPWPGPAIVKPDSEDASLGVDQSSVVTAPAQLAERIEQVRTAYGPRVLIEAYLPGREFNVGVLALPEPQVLPIAEVVYAPAEGNWPILTYAAKWHEGSGEDRASPVRCPAVTSDGLAARLEMLAIEAFCATGCRDYARIDFRLDAHGAPMILEVNPNPALHPAAGWARALRASGRAYEETIAALARQAIERSAQRL